MAVTVALTRNQFDALEALAGWLASDGEGFADDAVVLGAEDALVSARELRDIASIADTLPEHPNFD